jgi:multiple sugar transport system permease protein
MQIKMEQKVKNSFEVSSLFSIPHIFLLLCIASAIGSAFIIQSEMENAAKLGMVVLSALFGFLWLLFFLGDKYIRYTMILPGLMTVLAVTTLPIVFLLILSVFNVSLLNFNGDWKFVGLNNYLYFLTTDTLFFPAMIRTFEYTVLVLGFQLVIGMILALILQKEFKGRSFVSSILVIPVMASPIVIAMLWKYMYSSFNGFINLALKAMGLPTYNWLTNEPLPFIKDLPLIGSFLVEHLNANYGFLSAVIVNVWQWTPFVYLMLLAGLSSLPREPYEAAKVDGANGWQTFWNITFPLLKPVLSVVILIRMIDLMKVYDQIYALFGDSVTMRTLNLHIFSVGLSSQDYSKGAALSVIVLLLIIGLSLLFSGISKWVSKKGANA